MEYSFRTLNTEENSGKLLLATLSILSGTDFKADSCGYGAITDYETILTEVVDLANYVYCSSVDLPKTITSYIDMDSNEGKLLETAIGVLCSNECKCDGYGSHEHISDIMNKIIEITKMKIRKRSIDLII